MIEDTLICRVRYSETDKMGFVHHSNYARYYENARWELFRKYLITYGEIEKAGVLMPVVRMSAHFKRALCYDDEFIIRTSIKKMPGATLDFEFELKDLSGNVFHKAEVSLAFLSVQTKKACRPPKKLEEHMQQYFPDLK